MRRREGTTAARAPGALLAAVVTALAAALAASPAEAQLAPDTPRLLSPGGPGGFGVHWVRGEALPGSGDAVVVTWAPTSIPDGVRLRGGAGKGVAGEVAAFAGVDVQVPVFRARSGLPFDLDWTSGVGVGLGEYALLALPVGLSAGVSWSSGAVWMSPYVAAGALAEVRLGEDAPREEFQVHGTVDFGLDLSLDPERRVILRAAFSAGPRKAMSLGMVVGGGARTR